VLGNNHSDAKGSASAGQKSPERLSDELVNKRDGRALPLEPRMQISLLALWLSGAIVFATSGVPAQPTEPASNQSKQAEIHSVVVDMPQVIDLSRASPDSWTTLPPVRMEHRSPAPGQEAQARDDRSPAS
jgi:hypothetical protein